MAPPLGELSPKVTERALSALRAPLPQGEASDKRHKHPAASQLIGPAGRGENRFSLLKYVIFPGGTLSFPGEKRLFRTEKAVRPSKAPV